MPHYSQRSVSDIKTREASEIYFTKKIPPFPKYMRPLTSVYVDNEISFTGQAGAALADLTDAELQSRAVNMIIGEGGSASLRALRVGVALAGLAAVGGAAAAPYNPSHLADPDRAFVAGVCEGVMGLTRNNARFDACVEELSDSVVSVARGRDLARAQMDCLSRGLAPESAELAQCELREKDAPLARPAFVGGLEAGGPAVRVAPYWRVSNGEIHRREELSCAKLGLEPIGALFAACVAQLDAGLFAADNPAH